MAEITLWMRSFVKIADAGSFSAAAVRPPHNQSTLSKHVASLEAHLRTRLFNRTTRSLSLTDDGAIFYERAVAALAAIDEAEASIGVTGELTGVLRMTAPLTLGESRLIAMIKKFLMIHPGVEVDFRLSDHALNLASDNLDMAVRVGQLGDNQLVARKIGMTRRMLAASPEYLDRAGRPTSIADLTSHNCLYYALASYRQRWEFENGDSVQVKGNFSADSPNALRAAARSGMGIAVNAIWLFENDLRQGTLEAVLPDFTPVSMPINIILPAARHVAARTRSMIEFLANEFANDPLLAIS